MSDGRAGDGQPVARECSGGPLGLTPGTATGPRGTGGIPRGPADDAGPRGRCAAAGEGAAGWMVGVLGISRGTTGPSTARARGTVEAGRGPQARYSPFGPAPHIATRRSRALQRDGRGAACGGRGAVREAEPGQARYSPLGPAPQSAIRRPTRRSALPCVAAGAIETIGRGA